MAALAGVDSASEGLARAKRMHVPTTDEGVEGLMRMKEFDDVQVVFDATSAKAHVQNAKALNGCGKKLIDLTPAAIGPYVVPPVNLGAHAKASNLNMVSCGGQATIP